MTQMGFYYDAKKCSGCRACQIACKDRNDLPVGVLYRHVFTIETGSYPNPSDYNYSRTCNHCTDPQCVKNCPTGAMYKAEDGTVRHDDDRCIGCKMCVMSCPYGVPVYLEEKGITGKCDSCAHIRELGENPPCVDACCMRALEFGDIEELKKSHEGSTPPDIAIFPSPELTKPNTLIDSKDAMHNKDFSIVSL